MTIKLVAIDIDDTLLSSDLKILESTKVSIKKAIKEGIKVVLCTGRPLAGVTPYLNELGISGDDQYVITFNGSVIETVSGQVIEQQGLDNQTYREVDQFSKNNKLPYNVLDDDSVIYTSNRDVDVITVIQAYENLAGIMIREVDEMPSNFSIVKAVFCGTPEQLDDNEAAVRKEFDDRFYVVRAAPNFLEVMHKNVNKGNAVKHLANKLNIQPDEIMAIGDQRNDLPMFEFAGTAVSMGNGSDVAKKAADFVTHSNDEDGIAHAFDKFIFG
ncbi:hydrolase [Companilactobacillus sp. RD055328]|uniref:Cof-type HAD-IIB family hydrolase n=1 Tax=Companilactobacillus sp. RD055328 TaxID=2916634 RepID=UPI001FC829F8|nr:Cof-type HAD-IIB family hydrolase [Companilactobacillus sp. RD055328]GKQ43378.1 hydrolase [Companilactobacillus sp. RD055328]